MREEREERKPSGQKFLRDNDQNIRLMTARVRAFTTTIHLHLTFFSYSFFRYLKDNVQKQKSENEVTKTDLKGVKQKVRLIITHSF